jgi:hypothetical protein
MNRTSKLFTISALVVLMLIAGCGDDGNGPVGPGPYNAVTLDLYDFAHLANGYFYRFWVAESDAGLASSPAVDWVSLMEFNVNPVEGDINPDILTTITGQVISANTMSGLSADFEDYDSVLITIESPETSSGLPSSTVIATGQIPENFEIRQIGALDFPVTVDSGGASFFQFATPTDADTENELSGIWFMRGIQPLRQGLGLYSAPEGWMYEGWAWHRGHWLSTGKFTSPVGSDDFNGYSATSVEAPEFPGEDFLNEDNEPEGVTFPWTFEGDDTVLVTLEPSPDTEGGPFVIRLKEVALVNPAPGAATAMGVVETRPVGNVTFSRSEDL